MSLTPGIRLGVYEVTAKIGEGGMGEVYQARDTTLDRDVALKVLPEAFTADPDRLARFQREAKVLASLNHPNIGAIYGLEAAGDTQALVLELIEGPTLADRIAEGPIPVDEALTIAKQIAEALEAAHEQGIIHRDLKPANVKVRPDGTVKVLDFGLAKAVTPEASGTSGSESPTMSLTAATQMGMVIGTAAYMAPEQAKGKPVDKRADIWAFGVVVLEMLGGKRVFNGETASETLAAVMMQEPDWDQLPTGLSSRVINLVRRCLEKDPRERMRDIGDVRLAMAGAFETTSIASGSSVTVGSRQVWQRPVPLLLGFTAAVAFGALLVTGIPRVLGWRWIGSESAVSQVRYHLSIDLPELLGLPAGVGTTIAIAPDGRSLIYVGDDVEGRQLYVRQLDELRSTPIPGTSDATMPMISPDGEWIGFELPGNRLARVPASGGEPFVICNECENGSWGEDGHVIFSREGSLWRVPEVGGERELLVEPTPEHGVNVLQRPVLIPGGAAVLFQTGTGQFGGVGIFSFETQDMVVVTDDGADPFYSPTGHILFARRNILFAAPFDVDAFEVTGPIAPVLQGVRVENGGAIQAQVSSDGLLLYAPASEVTGTQLVWADRDGTVESVIEEWRVFYQPRLSPNGDQLVVEVGEGGETDLWVRDIDRGPLRRLTTVADATYPLWAPDSVHIAFSTGSAGSYAIHSVATDGSAENETLVESTFPIFPEAWSSDGGRLVFREDSPDADLFVLDVRNGGSRTALLTSEFSEYSASLSPNGDWLAYVSNRSGSLEVYVRAFPDPGPDYQVSSSGGLAPMWGSDETELFHRATDDTMVVLSLQTEPFRVVGRDVLFETPDFWGGVTQDFFPAQYDVRPDSQRLLMMNMRPTNGSRPKLHAVVGWFDELNRLAPIQ